MTTDRLSRQSGFSYVDVMIAMVILLVGILTMAAALTAALVKTTAGENQLRAKALASTVLENIMSARFIKIGGNAYTFDAIQNVGSGPGVFVTGEQPVYLSPGPDGIFATADDDGETEAGYTRTVTIVDVNNPARPSPPNPITERRITVTVNYIERGFARSESVSTSVANY